MAELQREECGDRKEMLMIYQRMHHFLPFPSSNKEICGCPARTGDHLKKKNICADDNPEIVLQIITNN